MPKPTTRAVVAASMSAFGATLRGFTPVTFFSRNRIIRSLTKSAVSNFGWRHVLLDAEIAPGFVTSVAHEHARVERLAVAGGQHDVRRDQRARAAELVVVAHRHAVVELCRHGRAAYDSGVLLAASRASRRFAR